MDSFLDSLIEAGFDLPDSQQQVQLEAYVALLAKWNKAINLIGRSTAADIWQRHVVDSYQVVPLVGEGIRSILDIGSGAGLPSVILAIMLPEVAVTACEINTKKASFLTTVRRELELGNFTVAHEDVTQLDVPAFDMITARAYATIADILMQSAHLVGEKTTYVLPKGESYEGELATAAEIILAKNMTTHTVSSITDTRGQIVLMKADD